MDYPVVTAIDEKKKLHKIDRAYKNSELGNITPDDVWEYDGCDGPSDIGLEGHVLCLNDKYDWQFVCDVYGSVLLIALKKPAAPKKK